MMESNILLRYTGFVYGLFVGGFLPLLYLYTRLYFIRNTFTLKNFFSFLGRLGIILILFMVIIISILGLTGMYSSQERFNQMIESSWYLLGFFLGLTGGITSSVIGFKRSRK